MHVHRRLISASSWMAVVLVGRAIAFRAESFLRSRNAGVVARLARLVATVRSPLVPSLLDRPAPCRHGEPASWMPFAPQARQLPWAAGPPSSVTPPFELAGLASAVGRPAPRFIVAGGVVGIMGPLKNC